MRLKGYRTIAFNLIAGIPLALEAVFAIASLPEVLPLIPNQYLPLYSLGVVLGNMWLRSVTTTPLGQAK